MNNMSIDNVKNRMGTPTIPACYTSIQKPTEEITPEDKGYTLIEYTPENQQLAMKDPNKYMFMAISRQTGMSSAIFSGSNTSIYSQLDDLGRHIDNGPYKLSGRDNHLTLSNSKANRKTSASYVFAGGNGELLSFEVNTEYSKASSEASTSSSIDPDTKELTTTTVQAVPNTDAMYQEGQTVFFKDMKIQHQSVSPNDAIKAPNVIGPVMFLTPTRDTPQEAEAKAYKNELDAQNDIRNSYSITPEDTKQYWDQLSAKFQACKEPKTQGDLSTMLRNVNTLEPYIIKKKVKVKTTVTPIYYGSEGTGRKSHTYQSQGDINARWREGYAHLKSDPSVTILPKSDKRGYRVGDDVDIIQEKEVEVSIPGARVLASPQFHESGVTMMNDTIESTSTKITAKATVLGRPALEEGMNVEIKNISKRYSGVWHITKISHNISQQGYICDIEFKQKDLPIQGNIISSKVNTQRIFKEINQVAEESMKTESWKYPAKITQHFLQWRKDHGEPDANYLVKQNPGNPKEYSVYKADRDFSKDKVTRFEPTIKVAEIDVTESTEETYDNN